MTIMYTETDRNELTSDAMPFAGMYTECKLRYVTAECSLGSILLACSQRGVSAILLGNDPDKLVKELKNRYPDSRLIGGSQKHEQLLAKVLEFIEYPAIEPELPLDVCGTAFQQRVWQELKNIPVGKTASYSEIAKRIGSPTSARAVARACANNNIAIAIPCHRVVKNDGGISGYRWGVERKKALLQKEAQAR